MLPSAHRKPERRDSKAFKMETQFNTGRAWFLSVALLLGTLGFVLVDHQSRTANLRGHLHEKHARANDKRKSELEELRKSHSEDHNQVVAHQKEVEAMKQWSEEAKGQMQELSQRAAQTPAHMSTLEAILARMTARPTEKDVAEAERLQKVMAGAD